MANKARIKRTKPGAMKTKGTERERDERNGRTAKKEDSLSHWRRTDMLRRAEEVCRMGCDAMRRGRREGPLAAREGGRRYVMRTADGEKRGEAVE